MEVWCDPDEAVLFCVVRAVAPPPQPRYFKVRARGAARALWSLTPTCVSVILSVILLLNRSFTSARPVVVFPIRQVSACDLWPSLWCNISNCNTSKWTHQSCSCSLTSATSWPSISLFLKKPELQCKKKKEKNCQRTFTSWFLRVVSECSVLEMQNSW